MLNDESRYINHDPFSGEEGDLRQSIDSTMEAVHEFMKERA